MPKGSESNSSVRLSQDYLRMANEIVLTDGSYYKLPSEYKNACAKVHNSCNSQEAVSEKKEVEKKIEQIYATLTNPKQKQKTPEFLGENKTALFAKASDDPKGKVLETSFVGSHAKIIRVAKKAEIRTQVTFASSRREGILADSVCRS